jgi:hypothetical protein
MAESQADPHVSVCDDGLQGGRGSGAKTTKSCVMYHI